MKAQIISGNYGCIIARQKSNEELEIGELLIVEDNNKKYLLQVTDLEYGSQLNQQHRELIAGMNLEEENEYTLHDEHLRNYNLAHLKTLLTIENQNATASKILPKFFSKVRTIQDDDVKFLTTPNNPLFLGYLRSGSKKLSTRVSIDAEKMLSHHVLIAATTGKGKSNLTSCLLWDMIDKENCGVLVLDPHDEYYGRTKFGLKDHPKKEKVVYYTPKNPPTGGKTLMININKLKPEHFNGAIDFSDPQKQAIVSYYKEYGKEWVKAIIEDRELKSKYAEQTVAVLKRRMSQLLDINQSEQGIICNGIFIERGGEETINDIANELENGKVVIVDTSSFSGSAEILIGSTITTTAFGKYKKHKIDGTLENKPVISIVLEEAPRVLGKEILEKGSNIFSTIAREGRKFKIGIFAITQLPSLIPRQILANMNTKIILGIEMKPERTAIIESSSQDLSEDERNIASLDTGEAIISSNFLKFATPIKIPNFNDNQQIHKKEQTKSFFGGIKF